MNGTFFGNVRSLFSAKTAPSIMTVSQSMKESLRQLREDNKLGFLFVMVLATLYPFAVTSGVSIVYFIQVPGYPLRVAVALLYNIVFNLLLVCCIYSLPFARLRSSLNILLWIYLALFTLFLVAHLSIYKQLPGLPLLMAIEDTNFQESYEYIISINRATVILSTLSTIPIWCCLFISLKKPLGLSIPLRWRTILGCWAFLFIISNLGFKHQFIMLHNPFLFASWMAREAVDIKAQLRSSVAHQTNNPVVVSISRPPLKSVTHVLILGESTTSRRMSLYGYQRRTNPLLESMRAKLLIDENACSSRGSTVPSMREIFTFADREHENLSYEQPNLL